MKSQDELARDFVIALVAVCIFTIIGIVLKAIFFPDFAVTLFGG